MQKWISNLSPLIRLNPHHNYLLLLKNLSSPLTNLVPSPWSIPTWMTTAVSQDPPPASPHCLPLNVTTIHQVPQAPNPPDFALFPKSPTSSSVDSTFSIHCLQISKELSLLFQCPLSPAPTDQTEVLHQICNSSFYLFSIP